MKIGADNLRDIIYADIQDIVKQEIGDKERLVEEMAEAARKKVSEKSPARLKAYPPGTPKKKPGRYKKGWIVKRETKHGETYFVVSNKNEPELTYILENGTTDRKTKRGFRRGKSRKIPHIRPAFDETVAEYEVRIK